MKIVHHILEILQKKDVTKAQYFKKALNEFKSAEQQCEVLKNQVRGIDTLREANARYTAYNLGWLDTLSSWTVKYGGAAAILMMVTDTTPGQVLETGGEVAKVGAEVAGATGNFLFLENHPPPSSLEDNLVDLIEYRRESRKVDKDLSQLEKLSMTKEQYFREHINESRFMEEIARQRGFVQQESAQGDASGGLKERLAA